MPAATIVRVLLLTVATEVVADTYENEPGIDPLTVGAEIVNGEEPKLWLEIVKTDSDGIALPTTMLWVI